MIDEPFAPRPPLGRLFRAVAAIVALALLTLAGAYAQRPADTLLQRRQESEAFVDSLKTAIGAPSRAELGKYGWLRMEGDQLFVPIGDAGPLLKAFGVDDRTDLLGVTVAATSSLSIGLIRYFETGFIRPEDLTRWTNDDILSSLRDSVADGNDSRTTRRLPPLEAREWIIPPHFDALQHSLIWCALIVPQTTPRGTGSDVAVNAVLFGRSGYFQISYLTTLYQIDQARSDLNKVLGSLYFAPGKGFEAFHAGSEPVAERATETVFGIGHMHKATGEATQARKTLFWVVIAGAGLVVGAVVIGLGILVRRITRNQRRRR